MVASNNRMSANVVCILRTMLSPPSYSDSILSRSPSFGADDVEHFRTLHSRLLKATRYERFASTTVRPVTVSARETARPRAADVPLTTRLSAALREHRHLRSRRVVCRADGSSLSADVVKHHVERAARRAGLDQNGVHRLRHTFCSHLAMRGAPARAIQELAGHKDLITTQRYMHLSPAALDHAIRLLESPQVLPSRGDMLETADH